MNDVVEDGDKQPWQFPPNKPQPASDDDSCADEPYQPTIEILKVNNQSTDYLNINLYINPHLQNDLHFHHHFFDGICVVDGGRCVVLGHPSRQLCHLP